VIPISFRERAGSEPREIIDIEYRNRDGSWNSEFPAGPGPRSTHPSSKPGPIWSNAPRWTGGQTSTQARQAPHQGQALYPQEVVWGLEQTAPKVWNGRLAMLGFSVFLLGT